MSDAFAVVAIGCISVGAGMIYLPAGVIALGVLLLAIAVGADR